MTVTFFLWSLESVYYLNAIVSSLVSFNRAALYPMPRRECYHRPPTRYRLDPTPHKRSQRPRAAPHALIALGPCDGWGSRNEREVLKTSQSPPAEPTAHLCVYMLCVRCGSTHEAPKDQRSRSYHCAWSCMHATQKTCRSLSQVSTLSPINSPQVNSIAAQGCSAAIESL